MEHQFVDNGGGPDYPAPADLSSDLFAGPGAGLGWRGAYLSSPIGPDPWGHRYLVNTVFLAVARDADAGTGEGQRSGGWSHDTFCISAGPNGQYETPFGGNAAPRRVPPGRRPDLHHFRGHAVKWRQPASRRP